MILDKTKPRAYTNMLLQMVETGAIEEKVVLRDLLSWMSEHDVRRFCDQNHYETLLGDDDE